jgi:hypothetical protein
MGDPETRNLLASRKEVLLYARERILGKDEGASLGDSNKAVVSP